MARIGDPGEIAATANMVALTVQLLAGAILECRTF
jgi:hypothetical protein